ncbi:unnamed protein product [Vicia faba]|uniref:Uncharacterized protein n=1 Tax=Vicia faba TaxID=3906 RepID=A0AAV0YI07_VICFA|nr:unnamed protein product [Vicia faba]
MMPTHNFSPSILPFSVFFGTSPLPNLGFSSNPNRDESLFSSSAFFFPFSFVFFDVSFCDSAVDFPLHCSISKAFREAGLDFLKQGVAITQENSLLDNTARIEGWL